MRCTAAELGHHAGDARQHLAQRRPRNFCHQDVARRDAGQFAFAVDHTRASRAPADACRMSIEPRMTQPNFVGNLRRFHVQRPRLEQFESGIVQRPFDFDWHAHDVFDSLHQHAELECLRVSQTRFGSKHARHRARTVNATDAMEFAAEH